MKYVTAFAFVLLSTCPAFAADNRPDPALTPGEVLTTDKATVCVHGYSKTVRHTTLEMKRETYRVYNVRGSHKHWKIDHLVPLSLGGADTMKNIWPSNFKAGKYNAGAKDRLELKIRGLVCDGKMPIDEAQKLFMTDWIATYDRYCPRYNDCPPYRAQAN